MLNCAACGVELRPGARFCDMCGAKVVTRCPACGAVLRDVARFCDLCGTPLSEGAVAPEATVTQPLALSQRPASAGVLRDGSTPWRGARTAASWPVATTSLVSARWQGGQILCPLPVENTTPWASGLTARW